MNRRVTPYQFLAAVYDGGWSDYSEYIFALVEELERESKRTFHTVCDAACGTGILLRELASDGIDRQLFGYDRSTEMARLARIRVPSATIKEGDLTDPPTFCREYPVTFDLVTCVYDSLNYLTTPEELTAFFNATRRIIAGDGVLLVDLNARALYTDRNGSSHTRLIDGVALREKLEYTDGPPPNATTTFTFDEGIEVHHQRPWDPDEVETILSETGWRLLDTLDVMDADDDSPSGKIVYLAVPGTERGGS